SASESRGGPAEASAMRRLHRPGGGRCIGVGDAERGKNGALQPFHPLRLGLGEMVEAEKVQSAVHDEVGQVVGERLTLYGRLAADRLEGKDDVAQRQDVPARQRRRTAGKI